MADELTAENAELLELGIVLGQNHAFGLIAGAVPRPRRTGFAVCAKRSYIRNVARSGTIFAPGI
jgi:hypothetical protein